MPKEEEMEERDNNGNRVKEINRVKSQQTRRIIKEEMKKMIRKMEAE